MRAKILIIEDNTSIRENILRTLRFENYEVLGAEQGLIGLKIAQVEQPDLIICDIMMPELDGYQTLAELRKDPRTRDIAFIFLTAKSERGDLRLGMELGADDYLTKPFTNSELLGAITARLERQHRYREMVTKVQALQTSIGEQDDLASHELRTPLSTMRLAIYMLKNLNPSRDQARYLEVLEEECKRESELISDLLYMQRLERSQTLPRSQTSLQAWLPGLVESFQFQAQQRKLVFVAQLPSPLPTLLTNRQALERILSELLSNTLRYSIKGGRIELTMVCSPESQVEFTITNPSVIEASELPRIFEKFYRIPRSQSQSQGSGLGLALVQQLVQQLGGKVTVRSQAGQTTFWVSIPS